MKQNRKFVLLVLIPVFIEAIIFLVIPILGTIGISFTDYNPVAHRMDFTWLDNYKKLFGDQDFVIALKNTLVFTVVAVILNIIISLTVATMISQLRSNKTRSFFRMIAFLPCIAPMVASAVVWGRSILNTKIGLVNQIIESFQESYDDKTQNAILDRICETYYPFKESLQAEFSSHIGAMVFSDYSFNGL